MPVQAHRGCWVNDRRSASAEPQACVRALVTLALWWLLLLSAPAGGAPQNSSHVGTDAQAEPQAQTSDLYTRPKLGVNLAESNRCGFTGRGMAGVWQAKKEANKFGQ